MSDAPPHQIRIIGIDDVTPDVRRYRCTKPEGYDFEAGQATDVALDADGWREKTRPFTFTSLPDEDHLEFTIKSYPDHDGVTEQIGRISEGDGLLIGDAWGAITDNGPGTFIAGGAGVTPFIAILRHRERGGDLDGCHLVFSSSTEADIINRDQFEAMADLRTTFLVTDQPASSLSAGRLDADALERLLDGEKDAQVYLCGPPPMMEDITEALEKIGVDPDGVTLEG